MSTRRADDVQDAENAEDAEELNLLIVLLHFSPPEGRRIAV